MGLSGVSAGNREGGLGVAGCGGGSWGKTLIPTAAGTWLDVAIDTGAPITIAFSEATEGLELLTSAIGPGIFESKVAKERGMGGNLGRKRTSS
jgi:hypothetical protein